jgi:hypothetical protein
MLVSLEEIKNYLGLNPTPVILNFDIDATANTLTRASGSWITAGVAIGDKLTLGGFSNAANNVQVVVSNVTALVLTISEIATMVTETGNSLSTFRIDNTTYDSFLTEQENIISTSVEGYCGRKFLLDSYIQKFYSDDYPEGTKDLNLFHFPLVTLTSVINEDETLVLADLRVSPPSANIKSTEGFFNSGEELVVSYDAGFADTPAPVKSVINSLIQERYNKKISGVSLDFGSDVQRVSIPGTISIDFDYSLQSNERKTAFGTILGNYVNVLDFYRSDRAVIGSGVCYVDIY